MPTNATRHEDGVGESVRCAPAVGFRCGMFLCVMAMDGFEKDPCGTIVANAALSVAEGRDDRGGLDVTEGGHANGALFARVSSVCNLRHYHHRRGS